MVKMTEKCVISNSKEKARWKRKQNSGNFRTVALELSSVANIQTFISALNE